METNLWQRFDQLNEIGSSLSRETNLEHLLEKILLAAKTITHADGGTLYRVSADGQHLHFAILRTDSLGLAFGGSAGQAFSNKFKDLPLYLEDGSPNYSLVAAYAALNGRTVNVEDAYSAQGFDFSGTQRFDANTAYRSQSFLTVPMCNHENEVIAVLQLINAMDPETGKVCAFSDADQRLAESLASQAAIALTNRQLINQMEALFESFISLINLAIDEKSPYTGSHCQRVPSLTMMLAEACIATKEGPLADFTMDEKALYALKIASMLHDCGKITTPVQVVDKATKLETIFDRIYLLDMRFEVVLRDAEIAMFKAIANGQEAKHAQQNFAAFTQQLYADRAFLRALNKGSEYMQPEDVERVKKISQTYRWQASDGEVEDFLSKNELTNLLISRGTLTNDERVIINRHIVATIRMLEALPWPKHLKDVPEYAGGHHERIDGKGYPKGLTKDEMSIPARMMAVADIFEALTASDRPYKSPMPLSVALKILQEFSEEGHLDPDLFAIFVKERVYLKYAQQFLTPDQLDLN